MRKPTFCICKNKDADQLRGNRETNQRRCFRYIDSTIPLLFKSQIPVYRLVCVGPGRKPERLFSHDAALDVVPRGGRIVSSYAIHIADYI